MPGQRPTRLPAASTLTVVRTPRRLSSNSSSRPVRLPVCRCPLARRIAAAKALQRRRVARLPTRRPKGPPRRPRAATLPRCHSSRAVKAPRARLRRLPCLRRRASLTHKPGRPKLRPPPVKARSRHPNRPPGLCLPPRPLRHPRAPKLVLRCPPLARRRLRVQPLPKAQLPARRLLRKLLKRPRRPRAPRRHWPPLHRRPPLPHPLLTLRPPPRMQARRRVKPKRAPGSRSRAVRGLLRAKIDALLPRLNPQLTPPRHRRPLRACRAPRARSPRRPNSKEPPPSPKRRALRRLQPPNRPRSSAPEWECRR